MRSATGAVQSVLVLGGNSELAGAVLDRLDDRRLKRVILAVRDVDAAAERALRLRDRAITVEIVHYDANDAGAHERVLRDGAASGDLDLVIVAFATLGDEFELSASPLRTMELVSTNGAAPCAAVHASALTLQAQGHGVLVVFSTVAAQRVRMQNAPYAAGKAALDGFTRAVADELTGSGVHVVLVRPGFVRGRMTLGRPDAPMATTPDAVADDVVAAIAADKTATVWSPPALRAVFAVLRSAPGPLWRRFLA